jgi:hypothetical protein
MPQTDSESSDATAPSGGGAAVPELVIHLGGLKLTLVRSVRLFLEAAIIPSLIFLFTLKAAGISWAVVAALGWLYLALGVRWILDGRIPGTLMLCAGMFHGRALVALLTASAAVYLLQPIATSVTMAVLFLGSAFIGRPVTIRLARDFVHVPAEVLARARVRRMFTEVALIWGLSRVIDAVVTVVMMQTSMTAGLLSRSLISPTITVLSIGICAAWGLRALRSDGIHVRRGVLPTPAIAPAA